VSPARLVAVFAAAFAGATVGGLPVLPFGLILHEAVAWPLTLAVAAAFAGLAAGWAAGPRVPLPRLVLAAEAGALVLALLYWSPLGRIFDRALQIPIAVLFAHLALLALGVTIAAARLRADAETHRRIRTTLVVIAAALLAVPATILLATPFGLTGA
jgi:hypothetical protein